METLEKGNIRALSRGLDVLRAINQHRSLSMMAISKICSVPYPTACRIIDTLVAEEVIEREPNRKRYRPTVKVKALSVGYQDVDALADAARPHIEYLTRDLRWPISVCRRVGMSMMICESTHAIAPFTLNMYHPGYTMPILGSSSGKVYLAYCNDADRSAILQQLAELSPDSAERITKALDREIDAIREKGYGTYDRLRYTANPGKTSAISLPLMLNGKIEGTMTLAFFASSMTMRNAIETYLPKLMQTAKGIEMELSGQVSAS